MPIEPQDHDLRKLGDRAKNILQRLRRPGSTWDPIVVEFAGSPKAGKSTTIDIISHFFKRMGFKVWAPTEGASKRTPYHLKRDLVAFNTWTLNYAISELLVAFYNVDHHDLVILDRGPFDSLAWMGLLRDRKELTRQEFTVFEKFALHKRWSDLIRRVYLFECQPRVSLARETDSKLTTQGGIAMNTEMLTGLLRQYATMKKKLKKFPLTTLDTSSKTTPKSTSYQLALDLLGLFESRRK